ncbi:unnamed protein product, partial [marine sediment metagenome]
ERVDKIAKVVYGADGVAWTPEAEAKAKAFESDAKYDEYTTMMVKTHLSLTHEPARKGGVGKTMLAALFSKTFADNGYSVLAIDADPDANLAATLGFPETEKLTPISEMKEVIEERTGVQPGKTAPFFKLNPKVDDIPEKYSREHNGIKLMIMGRMKRGGTGCYCPENALLQALVTHLLLARSEVVILDMEAGIEHLGRATARAVDKLIVVVEPWRRAVETAYRVNQLAQDIGLHNV